MVLEKGHTRAASYSFLSCFNGREEGQEELQKTLRCQSSQGHSYGGYQKLSAQEEETTLFGAKKAATIQLGGKGQTKPRLPKRSMSFSIREPKGGIGAMVKGAYEQALEAARKGTPHFSELFLNSQLFMHVTPGNVGPKGICRRKPPTPSAGFVHHHFDSPSQER